MVFFKKNMITSDKKTVPYGDFACAATITSLHAAPPINFPLIMALDWLFHRHQPPLLRITQSETTHRCGESENATTPCR
jgi:hypothetical protein